MLFVLGRCIMDREEELAPGGEYDKTHEKSETESADNSNQISTTIIERLGSGSRNVQLLTDLEACIARLEKPGCGDELGPLRKDCFRLINGSNRNSKNRQTKSKSSMKRKIVRAGNIYRIVFY